LHKIIKIQAFEPTTDPTLGAEISFSTTNSRKSFHLPRPKPPDISPPMAIETFAMDQDKYFQLMKEVESFHRQRNL
jgi:hypothetical protein